MTTQLSVPPIIHHEPQATFMEHVRVGDLLALDPYYGVERVLDVDTVESKNGVKCAHVHVAYVVPVPGHPPVERTRFIQRAVHEPVTRWTPIA